jgi:hypothetical protein
MIMMNDEIDLFRAQDDAKNLVINGAKRVGFVTNNAKLSVLEWLDPFLGLICPIGDQNNGFFNVHDLSNINIVVLSQWVIE